jgi:electron transfer flavoprotein alpha subunit
MTEPLLVLAEHAGGVVDDGTLETLTLARGLAARVEAVAVCPAGDGVARQLGGHGVERMHLLEHELLDGYAPEAWAEAVVQLVGAAGAAGVLAAGTDRGNEVLAHVAAALGLPLAANCTRIEPGADWTLTRLRWGGILLEDARLTADMKLATVAPHAVRPEEVAAGNAPAVERFAPELAASLGRTAVVARAAR